MQKQSGFSWLIVRVWLRIYVYLNVCICVLICIILNLPASEWIQSHRRLLVCKCVSACFIQCPRIGHHILMISSWSNYSAACITLSMWHTISRQLAWASKCQPIGCAISPVSDISISKVLPVITLKHQAAEIHGLPVSRRRLCNFEMYSCGVVLMHRVVVSYIYTLVSVCWHELM